MLGLVCKENGDANLALNFVNLLPPRKFTINYSLINSISTIPVGVDITSIYTVSSTDTNLTAFSATDRPIQSVKVGNRTFVAGVTSEPILIDEHFRVLRVGIPAPTVAPGLAVGAGAIAQVGYFRYYDELTGEYSSLGPPSATVTGSVTRTWTLFPTNDGQIHPSDQNGYKVIAAKQLAPQTMLGDPSFYSAGAEMRRGDWIKIAGEWYQVNNVVDDIPGTFEVIGDSAVGVVGNVIYAEEYRPKPRASHLCLYVSVAGALPREVVKIRLGSTAAYTESVPTLSLGEAFLETYEPMPQGTIIAYNNDRLFIAGGPDPTKVYISEELYPERYTGVNFTSKNGEAITGIFPLKEYTIITTANSVHILSGYTELDMNLRVAYYGSGCAGPLLGIVVDGVLYYAGEDGVFIYDGAPQQINLQRDQEWRETVAPDRYGYISLLAERVLKFHVTQRSFSRAGSLAGVGGGSWNFSQKGFRYLPSTEWILDIPAGREWLNDSYQDAPGTTFVSVPEYAHNSGAFTYGYNATASYIYRYSDYTSTAPAAPILYPLGTPFLILPPVGGQELHEKFGQTKLLEEAFIIMVSDASTTNIKFVGSDGYGPFTTEEYLLTTVNAGQNLGGNGLRTFVSGINTYYLPADTVYHWMEPKVTGRTITAVITGNKQQRWRFLGAVYLLGPGAGTGEPINTQILA